MKFTDALEQFLAVIKIHKDEMNVEIYEEWKERANEMLAILDSEGPAARQGKAKTSSKFSESLT